MQGRFLDIHGFVVFDRRNKKKLKKRMSISNTHLQNEGLDERKTDQELQMHTEKVLRLVK